MFMQCFADLAVGWRPAMPSGVLPDKVIDFGLRSAQYVIHTAPLLYSRTGIELAFYSVAANVSFCQYGNTVPHGTVGDCLGISAECQGAEQANKEAGP